MLPSRVMQSFRDLPVEIVGLCRRHPWKQLTTPPRPGLRSIRDLLVHMLNTEYFWIQRVVLRRRRRRRTPGSFRSLDAILKVWTPQRGATLQLIGGLTPTQRRERRRIPWDAGQTASIEEIVWHVITHDQYHRGQIFTRLALLGRRDLPDYDILRE